MTGFRQWVSSERGGPAQEPCFRRGQLGFSAAGSSGKPVKARPSRWCFTSAWRGVPVRISLLRRDSAVDQFLDLGSGIPTVGNVHEIAHEIQPGARIAYRDHDAIAVHHARNLLRDHEPRVTVTEADIREPEAVLASPGVLDLLDFARPIGVLAAGVLPFVPGDESAAIMARYPDHTAPGSYPAVSHLSRIGMTEEQMQARLDLLAHAHARTTAKPGGDRGPPRRLHHRRSRGRARAPVGP